MITKIEPLSKINLGLLGLKYWEGAAIGISLYYNWKRIGISEEELITTQKNLKFTQEIAENTLKISQEGQITERFTRAIDQLGSDKMEIRLGEIYALERISKESTDDYWPIMEILTAYVRKNSSAEIVGSKDLSLDVQAVLAVIKRREFSFDDEEPCFFNLRETCLREAHLEGAFLYYAHLEETRLMFANLDGAYLQEANFYRAHLEGASLKEVHAIQVHLEGANLTAANLEEAYFFQADLKGAIFSQTHLEEANLIAADLEGSNFEESYLEGVYLKEANLGRANLKRVDLTKANLTGAKNITVDQLSEVKKLYKAELDEDLRKQLEEKYSDKYLELIKSPG